jgi:cytochrome c oxidase assembly protein subunit 15
MNRSVPVVDVRGDMVATDLASDPNGDAATGRVRFWARLLAFFTFPLIWLGGLVTTQDAGMAVPDWPGTFGYNLWLYPISTWLLGPFDLFVEHGHRLLATFVGLLAICLVGCGGGRWVCWPR